MGNDILPIGTGSDYKLDTDIKDVTNYITLSTGSTACTGLKLLNVNLNGSSHELTGNKQTNPGTITETITNETIGDGQIKLTFTSIGNNDTNIGFKLDIKSPLMLDQPYIIEFKVSGVSDGQEYNGTATFTIVGIPGAEDGVFYSVNIEPNDFYIGFNESTDDIPANITVVKTIGPNHESVDISNLQTSGDECMYYYTDTDPILRKITNPININELNSANGLPTVLTVVYKNGLFIDSESAFIHREVKSIDYMQEMYAIQSKGTDVVGNYEANGDLDPDYWRESWVDAIAAYDFLQPDDETKLGDLTRLDDLDLELWNVMKIAYTDGSVSYTDFTNFGNGIRNIVELYQVTNPGVIINDTNIAAYKPIATVTKSAPQASIDALVAAGWSKAKPDSTAKFDCLWNVEIVVCEDNTCKATDVALINQMVYGESPYSLLIENQYPGVPADANGKVETANNANIFTSKATLMNGSDAITNNVTFAVAPYKIVVKETTGSNQERSFYCTGEDSDGYKYEVSDKSLYMHVARNTAYDTNPTIKNNRFYKADGSAPDGYTLNVLGTYKLTTSAITAEGSVFISSTSTYEQSIDDCYTFVQATYGEMKITDCIGVHRVKKGVPGIPYLYCGEWQPDTEYYSNEQRIDLVKVTVGDDATYYICQEPHDYTTYNHKSGDTFNPDLNKGWWQKFEGNYKSIATELLLAETGYIENLRVKMEQVDDLYVNQLYVRDDADASKNWITVDDIEVGQDDINKQYRYLDPVHWNTGNFHINTTGGLNSSNKLRFSLPVSAGVTSITLPNITVTGIWKHPQKDAIWITNTAVLRDSTGNTLATAPVRVYRDYECTDQLEPATGSHAPDANVPADVTYYQFYNTGNGRTRYVKIVFPPMKIQTADYNANEIYIEFKVGTCVAISGGSANYSFTATMDGYVLFAGTAKNTGVVIGKNGFTITNGDPRGQNGINVNTATVFINENGEMASQGFVLSNEINKIVVVSSIGQVGSEPGVLYLLQEP